MSRFTPAATCTSRLRSAILEDAIPLEEVELVNSVEGVVDDIEGETEGGVGMEEIVVAERVKRLLESGWTNGTGKDGITDKGGLIGVLFGRRRGW